MVNHHSSPVTRRTQLQLSSSGENPPPLTSAAAVVVAAFTCNRAIVTMTTKAVLLCRPNSHPFQERTLFLDQPVKVGRSVARARPGPNNGVFDCKVLSRNHALLWYDNGKFYLQDTKSSNGTFVNNQRLSKGAEESLPREVSSGDIVQFGVDVMENSRKVTHGCIIATLKLYLPDGKEAKASPSTAMVPSCPNTIATQELYQLAQYLQEALHREQMLENKLNTLQKLVSATEDATESSWKALIDEDRLLTRLEILENQVQCCSKNIGEDRLREEVLQLQEDKDQYQVAAKELLRRLLQERLEAVKKLQDAERSLSNAEEECKNLLETYETTQKELHDLAENYNSRLKEIQELTEKLQQVEAKEKEKEKSELESEKFYDRAVLIADLMVEGESIMDSVADFSPSDAENSLNRSSAVQVDLIENGRPHLNDELRDKLRDSEKELSESHIKVADLNNLLDSAQLDAVKSMTKVAQLEAQLQEANAQLEMSNCRIKELEERIDHLERKLRCLQDGSEMKQDPRLHIVYEAEVEDPTPTVTLSLPIRSISPTAAVVTTNGNADTDHDDDRLTEEDEKQSADTVISSDDTNQQATLKAEIEKLMELLAETRENKLQAEKEVARFKAELEDARNNVKRAADDSNLLRQQLQQTQIQGQEHSKLVKKLQAQVEYAMSCYRHEHEIVRSLEDKLNQQRYLARVNEEDAETLRKQLMEAQHSYKQAHNEAEQLRNKLEACTGASVETSVEKQPSDDSCDSELQIVREKCSSLKGTVLNLETQLRQVVNEKCKMQEEFSKFVGNQSDSSSNSPSTTDSPSENSEALRTEVEESKQQLLVAYSEIVNLKEKCAAYNEEKSRLRQQLSDVAGHNDFQMKAVSLLPIFVAIVGFIAIFYPSLVIITATLDPSLPS